MAGYLIEGRRRWPVIAASPRGHCSKFIQKLEGKACSDEETVPVTWSDEKLILLLYIAPAGDRTHDLPHTVASNMVKVSPALNHSATAAVVVNQTQRFILVIYRLSVIVRTPSLSFAARTVFSPDRASTLV